MIRLWAMGADAQKRAATRGRDRGDAGRCCATASRRGAVGLSTSYVDMDENLCPVPSRFAHHEEIDALAAVLGEYGRMLQVVPEFYNTDITLARVDQLAELSLAHGIPTTFSPLFDSSPRPDNVPRVLARVAEQFARGARVWPQVQTRPIDISFSLEQASLYLPRDADLVHAPAPAARATPRRAPDRDAREGLVRRRRRSPATRSASSPRLRETTVRQPRRPVLASGRTLGEIAAERGTTPAGAMIDLSLEEDLRALPSRAEHRARGSSRWARSSRTTSCTSARATAARTSSPSRPTATPATCSASSCASAGACALEHAVKKITGDTAQIWGLPNRGLLRPGQAADVVVFDPETIGRGAESAVNDMPSGGMRYAARARRRRGRDRRRARLQR